MGKPYPWSHTRARTAMYRVIKWGVEPCVRCNHVLQEGERVALEHSNDRRRYIGWSHLSACRVCGVKCSSSHGGKLSQAGRPVPAPVAPARDGRVY